MRKFFFLILCSAIFLTTSCQESLQERAQREAREYTERNCPTPPVNNTITDSIVYNPKTNVYTTYLRMVGPFDNEEMLKQGYKDLYDGMKKSIMSDPGQQAYVKGGFDFAFVCVSDKSRKVILELRYKNKELR